MTDKKYWFQKKSLTSQNVEYGYVEVMIAHEDIEAFQKIVQSVCVGSDFYYSPVIDYIAGDVSAKLHLTLFYGLIDERVERQKLAEHLQRIHLKTLKLGKPFLKFGYQNLYQVLGVEILDEDKELEQTAQSFQKFVYEKSVQYDQFHPHLTLAYVKPDFQLKDVPNFLKEIRIKEVKYFEK